MMMRARWYPRSIGESVSHNNRYCEVLPPSNAIVVVVKPENTNASDEEDEPEN